MAFIKIRGCKFTAELFFLRGCCNAIEEIEYMEELEKPSNLKTVIMKLPCKLRENWRTVACELLERHNRRAQFRDIVTFVERQVKMSSDPLFGDIQSTQTVQQKPQPRNTIRNNFATTVVTNSKSIQCCDSDFRSKSQVVCLFCKHDHLLEQCAQMQNKAHKEKLNFLKEKGLCAGHMSKDCEKTLDLHSMWPNASEHSAYSTKGENVYSRTKSSITK